RWLFPLHRRSARRFQPDVRRFGSLFAEALDGGHRHDVVRLEHFELERLFISRGERRAGHRRGRQVLIASPLMDLRPAILRPLLAGLYLVGGVIGVAAAPLKTATVTQTYNEVKVIAPSREDRPAAAGETISGDRGLRTGQASRAELEFPDRTLTRLGANTI